MLTDEHGGEQLDRIAVVRGEIRLADRVHLQPDRIANVLADGGDVVVRAAWKNARWQQRNGEPLDLLGMLGKCKTDRIDEPVWIGRRNGPTLALRLIAARKSEADAARVAAKACPREGVHLAESGDSVPRWVSRKCNILPKSALLRPWRGSQRSIRYANPLLASKGRETHAGSQGSTD